MYTVEKDIPVTPNANQKYPLDDLGINDSFLIPLGEIEENTRRSVLSSAKSKKIKVITRMTNEGLRVWRRS